MSLFFRDSFAIAYLPIIIRLNSLYIYTLMPESHLSRKNYREF